jgi:UDP-N-acetylmuramyl pentapeptide synthase
MNNDNIKKFNNNNDHNINKFEEEVKIRLKEINYTVNLINDELKIEEKLYDLYKNFPGKHNCNIK